jgi:hypothetical protein
MKGLKKEAEARAGEFQLPVDPARRPDPLHLADRPTDDPEMTAYRIEEGLEGMTPYAVSELVYDWRTVETDRVKLAAVARETLDEARTFAEGHGFKTAGFAAMPPQERFPGVPLFELAKSAADVSFPDDGIAFGPDTFGQEPEETGDTEEVAADAPPTGPEADAAPSDPTGDAAKAAAPEPEPEPEPQPEPETEPEPDPDPQADALADAADRDPEEIIAAAAEAPAQPDPEPPIAEPEAPVLEDPALTEPVAPIGDADGDDAAPAAPGTDTNQPPEFSARGTRVPARDIDAPPDEAETGEPEPGPAADAPSEDGAQAAQNPLAQRLSRVREASKARGPKTAKPVVPPSREGAAAVPPQRKGRLSGLSATPFPGTDETAAPDSASRKGLGGRIGGMLGRGTSAEAAPAEPPHDEPGARSITGTGRLSALGEALRLQPQDGTLPDADAPARDGTEDANLTDGLLGRKPEEPTGKSFRTGLLLTIVLLILLAAIAVWSALFLPDSPVARLFGGGSEVAAEDPLDAPDAPFAITAPPAIGELATVDAPPATLLEETEPPQVDAAPEDEAAADGIDLATPDDAVDEVAEAVVEAVAETQAETPAIPPLPPLPLDAVPEPRGDRGRLCRIPHLAAPAGPAGPRAARFAVGPVAVNRRSGGHRARCDFAAHPAPRPDRDAPPRAAAAALRRAPRYDRCGPRRGNTRRRGDTRRRPGDRGSAARSCRSLVRANRPCRRARPTFSIEDAILGTFRPAPRPGDLGAATPQDALPGRPAITRASLSPQPRALPPEAPTASEQAAAASLFPRPDRAEEPAEISAAAVARSLVPAARPGNAQSSTTTASPRKAKKPTTSVTVVTKAPEASAGSILSRSSTTGIRMPASPATSRLITIAAAITTAQERRAEPDDPTIPITTAKIAR